MTQTTLPSEPQKATVQEELNPYLIAQKQFDAASKYVANLPEGLREFLRVVNRIIYVNFPVEMDDGTVKTFSGFRCVHSHVRGPAKEMLENLAMSDGWLVTAGRHVSEPPVAEVTVSSPPPSKLRVVEAATGSVLFW